MTSIPPKCAGPLLSPRKAGAVWAGGAAGGFALFWLVETHPSILLPISLLVISGQALPIVAMGLGWLPISRTVDWSWVDFVTAICNPWIGIAVWYYEVRRHANTSALRRLNAENGLGTEPMSSWRSS